MRKIRASGLVLVGWGMAACSSSVGPKADVVTTVSGVADFAKILANRSIVVYDFENGTMGAPVASAETDDKGAFTVKLGPFSGAALVEVLEDDQADHLDTVVADLAIGEARAGLAITPITHLATRYAETLASSLPVRDAVKQAFARMDGHFGGIDHRTTRPADVTSPEPSLTKEVVAGVMIAGFVEDARRFSASAPGGVTVQPEALVETYARDIEDGVFDGRGRFGAVLSVAGQALDADSLRLGFGQAVTAFLSGPGNGTGLSVQNFKGLVQALEDDDSVLFPTGSVATRDMTGPAITVVEFVDPTGKPAGAGHPLRGGVQLHVHAEKPAGVAEIHLEKGTTTTTTGVEVVTTTAAVGMNSAPAGGDAWFPIATAKLADGPHALTVVATDTEGNQTHQLVSFVTANTPPVLTLAVLGPSTLNLTVRGRVSAAVGPSDVTFSVNGMAVKDLASIQGVFEVALPGACNASMVQVSAVATDAAGNASVPVALTVMCDTTGPTITLEATSFLQEGDMVLSRGPDGVVHYDAPGATRTVVVSDMTSPWPAFEKYFNRLDVWSDNLPTLNLRIRAADGSMPTAQYRYLLDGIERRSWTSLAVDPSGLAVLPLAYQTLSQELGRRPKNAVHGIEVKAVDGVGNVSLRSFSFAMDLRSPPVWLDGCGPSGAWSWSGLPSIFTSGQPIAVAQGLLSYPLDLKSGSLAPTDGMKVTFAPVNASVALTGLQGQAFRSSMKLPVSSGPPEACAMGCYYFAPSARCDSSLSSGCRSPDGGVQALLAGWSAAQREPGSIVLGAQESPGGDGTYRLSPGSMTVLEVLTAPSFSLGGSTYDWSTDTSAYAAYSTGGARQGRYRVPQAYDVLARSDCDYFGEGGGGVDPSNFDVTVTCYAWAWLPTVTAVTVATSPWSISAQHSLLDWLSIGVRTSPACAAGVTRTLGEP